MVTLWNCLCTEASNSFLLILSEMEEGEAALLLNQLLAKNLLVDVPYGYYMVSILWTTLLTDFI